MAFVMAGPNSFTLSNYFIQLLHSNTNQIT